MLINWRENFVVQVGCLVTENDLLENKHRELKETITNLLRSKEGFVKIYEVCVEFWTRYCICYCFLAEAVLMKDFFFATFSCTLFFMDYMCLTGTNSHLRDLFNNWILGLTFCCFIWCSCMHVLLWNLDSLSLRNR